MAEILVLTKDIPLPIQSTGTSLRLLPILRHLVANHVVDLAAVGDRRPEVHGLAEEARAFCREVIVTERADVGRVRRWSRTARALLDAERPPWESVDPYSSEYLVDVEDLIHRRRPDILLAVGNVMDVTSRLLKKGVKAPRVVVDWVDAPSLLHERRTLTRAGGARTLDRVRTRRLVEWQQFLNARVDAAIYIAELDRAHAGEAANDKVFVVGNGVLETGGSLPRGDGPPTLGFLGNMAYDPNVQAALRLHDRVFRPLTESIPSLRLKIIGRAPVTEIQALASPSVEVTGEVDSIWPHLAEVDVMVFPMEMGGGLQNKVLEAVAAGCAVVVTAVGAAGTGAAGREALLIEDTDEGMVAAVARLLDDPKAIEAARGRAKRILEVFDWAKILPRYERIVLGS